LTKKRMLDEATNKVYLLDDSLDDS
jgi:hypothetical protein